MAGLDWTGFVVALVAAVQGFVVCCLDLNFGHWLAGPRGAGAEKKVLEGFRGAVWVRIVYKMI
jgi:hypothetical protein